MQRIEEVEVAKKKMAKKSSAPRAPKKLDLTQPVKIAPSAKARTKSGLFQTIADHVGIHRRDVAGVFHVMASTIKSDLSKNGSGVSTLPGLLRITVKRKPATKAREGINPFTKEPITIKAKPARNVVRVRPLRALKAMV
jgi:nucleoid DNA-binding protein